MSARTDRIAAEQDNIRVEVTHAFVRIKDPGAPDPHKTLPYFGTYNTLRLQPHPCTSVVNAARLLQVTCPHCGVGKGRWCRRPNGTLFEVLHHARWRSAEQLGWWGPNITIELLDVEWEPYQV